jgi:gliding motility-associated lipoprotein GldH
MRNKQLLTILTVAVAALFAGCDSKTVYSHYEHTPQEGWEKIDTLFFEVPPVKEAGIYQEEIGIRTDISFPFQSLALNVAQDVLPQGEHYQTTKNCVLYDETGKERGSGISRFQTVVYLTDVKLNEGESMRISITHNMRRELMSGVSDIGIILTKK